MDWFKPPRGHEEVRASFPNQIHKSSHTNNIQIYPKEMNWGRGTQGRRPGETENSRTQYKSRTWPNTSEGVFIPAGPVRPVRWTGQTGWLDRSDRCQGPVRPVGLQHPLYTISSDGRGSFFETKSSPRCRRLDEDPVRGFGGSAKPG